jgi:hypothetical protein
MTTDQLIYLIIGGAGLGLFVAACGSWSFHDPDWHSDSPGPEPGPESGPESGPEQKEQARKDALAARDQARKDADAIKEQVRKDADAIKEQARKDVVAANQEVLKAKARGRELRPKPGPSSNQIIDSE